MASNKIQQKISQEEEELTYFWKSYSAFLLYFSRFTLESFPEPSS